MSDQTKIRAFPEGVRGLFREKELCVSEAVGELPRKGRYARGLEAISMRRLNTLCITQPHSPPMHIAHVVRIFIALSAAED
jgi:hypothetical protein